MRIYFAGSIRGGRDDVELYIDIIEYLKNFGEVLTEHIGNQIISSDGENNMSDLDIHDRDMNWLLDSDIIIAEVTNPSLGVGYEIGRAIENNKKIICLYRKNNKNRLSAMIAGSEKIININYSNLNDFKLLIDKHLKKT
ncbi:MAG: nucleoside 2-deoxyribosyltransferase [Candidatus Marinimicrobia bacterium]|nr:nucleoside 2-deoxyribosyltransferase [Candidatus Neomarinimicrobiota bacterium]